MVIRRAVLAALLAALCVPADALAWTWPATGPVLQQFAFDRTQPYAAGQHRGIDIGAPSGGAVVAPAGGIVTFAGTVPTSGKCLTITTADGYAVTLTHLGSMSVTVGATVAERDVVGAIGPSGDAEVDGPYVHLGIRIASDENGYFDPAPLLPAAASPPPPDTAPPAPVAAAPSPPADPAPVTPPSTSTAAPPTVDASAPTAPDAETAAGGRQPAPTSAPIGAPQTTGSPAEARPATAGLRIASTRPGRMHVRVAVAATRTKGRRPANAVATSPHRRSILRRSPTHGRRSHRSDQGDRAAGAASARPRPARRRHATRDPDPTCSGPCPRPHASCGGCRHRRELAPPDTARRLADRRRAADDPARWCSEARSYHRPCVDAAEDPGRTGLAVCGRVPPHRSRGGARRTGGRVRAVSPAARERRSHGQRDGRARNARDGCRRPGGTFVR